MSRWALRLVMVGVWGVVAIAGCSSSTRAVLDVEASGDSAADQSKKKVSTAQEKPGEPFRLPGDDVGKVLAKTLPPAAPPALFRNASPPAPPPGPRMPLRLPESPVPGLTTDLLRLPALAGRSMPRPEFVLEEGLDDSFDSLRVPQEPSFPAGRLAKAYSDDVSIAPPLPLVATRLPGGVSLDDATMEASTAIVLSAPLPTRTTALPFARLTRPEPYENRLPLTLMLPEERGEPRGGPR